MKIQNYLNNKNLSQLASSAVNIMLFGFSPYNCADLCGEFSYDCFKCLCIFFFQLKALKKTYLMGVLDFDDGKNIFIDELL